MHTTNPHNPPAPSGYADENFELGQRVWVALEDKPCVVVGQENGAWLVRATDGVEMTATAQIMSPAADEEEMVIEP